MQFYKSCINKYNKTKIIFQLITKFKKKIMQIY